MSNRPQESNIAPGRRRSHCEAARDHLAAGYPIYYSESDTPAGLIIKEYPDGRRELVRFDYAGEEHHARNLPSEDQR